MKILHICPGTQAITSCRRIELNFPEKPVTRVDAPEGLLPALGINQANDFEKVGALYIELQLVCRKIMSGLTYGELEKMFIRSASGCVVLLSIADKGLLACMSTPDVNDVV